MIIFKKGELFCGPGGLALAAKNSSFKSSNGIEYKIEHQWANDIDFAACKTFVHNICNVKAEDVKEYIYTNELNLNKLNKGVLCKDVRELDITKLPTIDAFTFGFPCNDYSNVGEKKGIDGNYGPLYTYGVKVLNHHNPKWFLAENVSGLQSANDGETFKKIITDLSTAGTFGGYTLTTHLYKFEEYGVPQMRHRIIIVGIRKDLSDKGVIFKVPAPTTPNKTDYKTSKWALELGYDGIEVTKNGKFNNNERTCHPNSVIERLTNIPPGENVWYEGLPEHLKLNVKGAKLSNIYKRLDPNKPAYTVTGSGGGGTHMYHYKEPRALTNRERARLQTFPDCYEFLGNKEDIRKQIGMAVPPHGAQIIIQAILKSFANESYDFIEPKWSINDLRDER